MPTRAQGQLPVVAPTGGVLPAFLQPTGTINADNPLVQATARQVAADARTPFEIVSACFEWVRDEILHTDDHRLEVVTCSASHVLEAFSGSCYAKSHLLAALLRVHGIPAGLCYQRLVVPSLGRFALHGLAAAYLPVYGWYRMDPRGEAPGIHTEFAPPLEHLAFAPKLPGERLFDCVLSDASPLVVQALTAHRTREALAQHLPDAETPEALLGPVGARPPAGLIVTSVTWRETVAPPKDAPPEPQGASGSDPAAPETSHPGPEDTPLSAPAPTPPGEDRTPVAAEPPPAETAGLLAALAREVGGPLAPIENAVQVLRLMGPADPQLASLREVIDRNVKQLRRLANDLLDVARLGQGTLELRRTRVEVSALVARALEESGPDLRGAGYHLEVHVPERPLHLHGDGPRLAAAITHLLASAAQRSHPGGVIQLRAEREGDMAVLRVHDDGAGMPPEALPRVFEPFAHTDGASHAGLAGPSLGLAIVKGIVEGHGGAVGAAGMSHGNELTMRLPLASSSDSRVGARQAVGDTAPPRPVLVPRGGKTASSDRKASGLSPLERLIAKAQDQTPTAVPGTPRVGTRG